MHDWHLTCFAGRVLQRGDGIDPRTRFFATADMNRPGTNKLSGAVLNRVISLSLPPMDSGLTVDNAADHDLYSIMGAKFCDTPGGAAAAILCLKIHAKVKEMVLNKELTLSNGFNLTFRTLQQVQGNDIIAVEVLAPSTAV